MSPHHTPSPRHTPRAMPACTAAPIHPPMLLLLALLLAGHLAPPPALAADAVPAAFLATWRQSAEPGTDARAVWKQFAADHTGHELGQLARLLIVAAHLRANDFPAAAAALPTEFRYATPEPANPSAAELRKQIPLAARSLAARVSLLRVADKLRAHYAREVEYPAALADLVPKGVLAQADLLDPFGQPWTYTTAPSPLDPKLARQRYTLACVTLKLERRDAAAGLDRLAEPPRHLTLTSLEPADGRAYLKARRPDGAPGPTVRIPLGAQIETFTLWATYDAFALLGAQGLPRLLLKEERPAP